MERVRPEFWWPDERVLHVGTAVHESIAERFGRGEGEGVLYLTTHRFIFWYDKPRISEFLAIPKDDIRSVKTKRIVIPKMRAISLELENTQTRFYAGRPFAGIIERDWQLDRPLRRPRTGVEYPNIPPEAKGPGEDSAKTVGDPATLKGTLISDPSVRVIARIEDDEVVITSLDRAVQERFPVMQMTGPAETPSPDSKLAFVTGSPYWGFLVIDAPVPDRWISLAEVTRERVRAERAATGSNRSTGSKVADASEQVQRVWYVLPSPVQGHDIGIGVEGISTQTGLEEPALMLALGYLEGRGLAERNDKGDWRRVESPM